MHLKSLYTGDYFDALTSKAIGPTDVIGLVKSSLKFYEYRDLLPVFSRINQCGDNLAIICQTIECHHYLTYFFVNSCLPKQSNDVAKIVIGSEQHDVLLINSLKNAAINIYTWMWHLRQSLVLKLLYPHVW